MPVFGILLASGACGRETCGFTNSAPGCRLLYKDENASGAIGVRIELTRAQLTIDDTAAAAVVARNYGKKSRTVPTQTCAPALQTYEYLGKDLPDGPIVYPPANFICNGESYPGALLAPGDSMVVKSELMSIIRNTRKALNLPLDRTYVPVGRIEVDDRSVNYANSVLITVLPKP